MCITSDLLVKTSKGIYCPKGDFYIDPVRAVKLALISHGHADHAKSGHGHFHCTDATGTILDRRLNQSDCTTHAWEESFEINGVKISFHPAGHVLGSAQIRLESEGKVWVFSGDYKRQADSSCEPFRLVPCDVFITEATFALPVYQWKNPEEVFTEIHEWVTQNQKQNLNSVLLAYSLGKAQRLLTGLLPYQKEPIWVHKSIEEMNQCYSKHGVQLPLTSPIKEWKKLSPYPTGQLIILPQAGLTDDLVDRLGPHRIASASGWNMVQNAKKRVGPTNGFVVSDHVDWPDLVQTIRETGAKRVWVTHGQNRSFARYLRECEGVDAIAWEDLENDARG